MLELVLLLSILLVVISGRVKNRYIQPVLRAVQILYATYCLSFDSIGPAAKLLSFSNELPLLYFFIITIISCELETLDMKKWLRESIFLLSNILILSSSLAVFIVAVVLTLSIYLVNRKSYLIDYISVFIVGIISLIYFSELSETVLTTTDSYYLYLRPSSGKVFFPLLLIFALVEFMRLYGYKRNISSVLTIIPMILVFKLKHSNEVIDNAQSCFLLLFLLPVVKSGSQLIRNRSIGYSVKTLFLTSLMGSFCYLLLEKYELALTSTLIQLTVLAIYINTSRLKIKEAGVGNIIIYFTIFNLAALPLSYSGLMFIDLSSTTQSIFTYFTLILGAIISWAICGFVIRKNSDELYVNVLEATTRVKLFSVVGVLLSLLITFMSLSIFVSGPESSQKLMQLIFQTKETPIEEGFMSYNLTFIVYLIIFVILGYLIKTVSMNHAWRVAFILSEFVDQLKFSKLKRPSSSDLKRVREPLGYRKVESGGHISSFQLAFYIFIIFIITSLAIIEF